MSSSTQPPESRDDGDASAAPEAFDFYVNGDFMGKVVIRL